MVTGRSLQQHKKKKRERKAKLEGTLAGEEEEKKIEEKTKASISASPWCVVASGKAATVSVIEM